MRPETSCRVRSRVSHVFSGACVLAMLAGVAIARPAASAHLNSEAAATVEPGAPRPSPHALTLSTERAVVFKDGHAMIVKKATGLADEQGRVYTEAVPDQVVLGCFWAISDRGGQPVSLRAEWVTMSSESTRDEPCGGVRDLLKANVGRPVTLTLASGKPSAHVVGTIKEVLDGPQEHQSFVVLEVSAGETLTTQVLAIGDVQSVSGDGLKTTIARTNKSETRSKRLTADLGPSAAGQPVSLRLFYFTPGVRWIPTYRVTGLGAQAAQLSLQGEILNELEDLTDAELDLVVGVPNFRFKDVLSPLTLEHAMRETLQHSGTRGREMLRQQFSNAAFDQRDDAGAPGVTMPIEVAGSGEQDLFVYNVGRFSLAKGARATLPLWAQSAPLRHVYTYYVKPQQARQPQTYGGPVNVDGSIAIRPEDDVRVWHQLELANEAKRPWTSGPALTMQDFTPIGQDLLPYTAPGGKSLLPLTVAVDVQATYDEEELERKPASLRIDGYDYFLVKKRGTITVKNYRQEASQCCVNVRVIGTVDPELRKPTSGERDPLKPTVKLDALRQGEADLNTYTRVNNVSELKWDLPIAAGSTQVITFEYGVYMR